MASIKVSARGDSAIASAREVNHETQHDKSDRWSIRYTQIYKQCSFFLHEFMYNRPSVQEDQDSDDSTLQCSMLSRLSQLNASKELKRLQLRSGQFEVTTKVQAIGYQN